MAAPKKTSEIELLQLQAKDPMSWSVSDVGLWLNFVDLAEYKITFIENSISGAELFDLKDEDLISMNMNKLGHRKKLLRRINLLKTNSKAAFNASDNDSDQGSNSGSSSGSSNASGPSTRKELTVKCSYDDEIRAIRLKKDTSFEALKKAIKKEYKRTMTIKYKDSDGDLLTIRKEEEFEHALANAGKGGLKVFLFSSSRKNVLSKTETALLENLVDGVVIIDSRGTVLFVNKAAEKLWGYSSSDLLNNNVKMLMGDDHASKHDSYLKSYLSTGKAKIIGTGRKVKARRKDGSEVPIWLTISELKTDERHTFTATLQQYTEKGGSTTSESASKSNDSSYFILDNLLDMALVIDEKGTIQFANRETLKILGYTGPQLVGRNVKLLMPSPFAEEHDSYLRNYLTTNVPKVIGTGREVIAQCRDGSIIPVHLSLSEQRISDSKRIFTGILRRISEEQVQEKSLLQQEREVLETLLVPAIIIDEKGIINGFNAPASELLCYKVMEVLGKNVKMLMGGQDKEKHDEYLQKYLATGKSKVIGVGRDVVAMHKDGTPIPVRLSVTTKKDASKRIFAGVLQRL
eukprot:TRINITY_DN488_c0_g2_i1.p1 TRINITY_DN488_c0_g2~~TRINITY_DN488_c0_g2_i1.p1  ORF type:complete len:575 (+),score=222.84 TRINITY_DN488_c0_g2_i1:89-1813(+)